MSALLDWLLPACCELCGLRSGGPALCRTCAGDLPRIEQPCPGCALPTPAPQLRCGRCLQRPPPWDTCLVPLVYSGPVRTLVLRLKRDGSPAVLAALVAAARPVLEQVPGIDTIVPIPSTRWRNFRRGFNPAELVARGINADLRVGVDRQQLQRRPGPRQAGLSRTGRERNVRGVFDLTAPPARRVLLVDDVMTSGATLREATRTLQTGGAAWVGVLALARTLE